MTYANIAAIWALALCLVATGWTHEQGYQESLGEPKYDASEQIEAACASFMARNQTPTQ
jgi:hypothetical protein